MSAPALIEQRQKQGQQIDFPLMQLDEPSVIAHNAELSSMLATGYTPANTSQGYGSFAALKDCRSSTPLSPAGLSFTSASSIIDDITMPNDTEASMTWCGYPTAHGLPMSSCETIPTECFNPLGSEVTSWWEGRAMNSMDVAMTEFGLHDGLPRFFEQKLWTYDLTEDQPQWNPYSPITWTSEESGKPVTTIPGSLNQQRSRTSVSSKSSNWTSSEMFKVSANTEVTPSTHDTESNSEAEKSTRTLRHTLPSSRMSAGNKMAAGPAITRKNATANNNTRSWRSTNDSMGPTSVRRSSRTVSATTGTPLYASKPGTSTTKPNSYLEADPYGINAFLNDIKVSSETAKRRKLTSAEQDQYLLKARKAGLSYKTIRAQGKFLEAESTLRGRYRSLTKDKKDRVRKPQWTEVDVGILPMVRNDTADYRLLQKAVQKHSDPSIPITAQKFPWKKIAEYIVKSGGTYGFSPATCSKRWDELTKS
ncbi:HMG box-containing protein [Rutstroemia sp. NJR-2017a WRK4]|nr:HMG box-containing protein [Rutstroemia sp. NJR-2017a WRK4]